MSFTLRQRGNPHEGEILLGGGMVESNEFFSSSNRKSSQEKILMGGVGEGIMRITSLTMTEILDSLFYFSP